MVPQKMLYFFKRLRDMGPFTASWLLYHRLKRRWFIRRWRKKIQHDQSYHTWQELSHQHNLGSFTSFFTHLQIDTSCEKIVQNKTFSAFCLGKKDTITEIADNALNNTFSILGFGTFTYNASIDWHGDITTRQPSPAAWASAFYADITIPTTPYDNRQPDIKVPWELSRMQHLFAIGHEYAAAYQNHNEARCSALTTFFVNHVNDWIKRNPFLCGVTWNNPMEVALRSINLIWAFHFFKHSTDIELSFWERYVCVLYDHLYYLENNWEVSDRPNNHLLADMVGYLYLCTFFSSIRAIGHKRRRFVPRIFRAFQAQILEDGTSYEGSTSYHFLVTELLLHAVVLCEATHTHVNKKVSQQLHNMIGFATDCAEAPDTHVHIGDNDSGAIVTGLCIVPGPSIITTYKNFGLSIIKKNGWVITFRHPTFSGHQPSGHFHNDQLALTLSIDGTPILIDPGTYLYTSNPHARNYFRNFQAHNTFFLENATPLPHDLFQLHRTIEPFHATIQETDSYVQIYDFSNYFLTFGLQAHRRMTYNFENAELSITDWWEYVGNEKKRKSRSTQWNFHCGPKITVQQQTDNEWILKTETNRHVALQTTIRCTSRQDEFSAHYGAKTSSTTLQGSIGNTSVIQNTVIRLTET